MSSTGREASHAEYEELRTFVPARTRDRKPPAPSKPARMTIFDWVLGLTYLAVRRLRRRRPAMARIHGDPR